MEAQDTIENVIALKNFPKGSLILIPFSSTVSVATKLPTNAVDLKQKVNDEHGNQQVMYVSPRLDMPKRGSPGPVRLVPYFCVQPADDSTQANLSFNASLTLKVIHQEQGARALKGLEKYIEQTVASPVMYNTK